MVDTDARRMGIKKSLQAVLADFQFSRVRADYSATAAESTEAESVAAESAGAASSTT